MAHALPRGRFGQRTVEVDANPALLIGRAGGRDALRRHRLIRRLAQVRGRRLQGEEGTKPREHASRVGQGAPRGKSGGRGSAACCPSVKVQAGLRPVQRRDSVADPDKQLYKAKSETVSSSWKFKLIFPRN